MTTKESYHRQGEPVTYGKPVIGPRVYLVKGPSGWSEAFDRKASDAKMVEFLAPLVVRDLIPVFKDRMRVEGAKAYSWSDIMGWLAGRTTTDQRSIPDAVAIAFWAHVIMFDEAQGAN